jgi:hypothetical protein
MRKLKPMIIRKLKFIFSLITKYEKIFFTVFAAIYVALIILHIAFYQFDDKLTRGIEIAIMPLIVYPLNKLMFKLVRVRAIENFVIGLIAFFGFGMTYGFIMFVVEYITQFPNGLATGIVLCMAGFSELISEMKLSESKKEEPRGDK